jgi:hypothetical protein
MSPELHGEWTIVFHFEVYKRVSKSIIYNRTSLLYLIVYCKYKSITGQGNQAMKIYGKLKLSLYFFSFCSLTRELAPILEHRADYSVSWSFTGGRTPWTGDQLVARPLPVHKHRKTRTHIPRRDSTPQSRPPSDRRLFMPQTARLSLYLVKQ